MPHWGSSSTRQPISAFTREPTASYNDSAVNTQTSKYVESFRSRLKPDRITKHFLFNPLDVLKPTGYVMHHQFNIQQLYALPTLYLCVLYLSENKQRLVPLTA